MIHPPLAIDIIIDHLEVGGSEIQTLRLAARLAQRGHDVQVVSLLPKPTELLPEEQAACSVGVDIRHSAPGQTWLQAAAVYLRHRHRRSPDLVYAVLVRSQVCAMFGRVFSPGTPLVVSRRFAPDQVRGARRLLRDVPLLGATAVLANNRAALDDPWSRRLIRRRPTLVTGNFPAHSRDGRVPIVRPPGFVVGSVANLRSVKGHRYLLEAVARLRGAGYEVSLLLAGEGPLLEQLRAHAKRLAVPAVFLGRVDDVAAVLAVSDVVAQASISEGYPNAVLEAMAAGSALVATDVGATREVLGEAGVLVAPEDAQALADGIWRLLVDPAARATLGAAARLRVAQMYVDPTDDIETFFAGLVRTAGRPRAAS